MFKKFVVTLCAIAAVSAGEADLETQVLKGYYNHPNLKLSHEFYIPPFQCSGLINGNLLVPPNCPSHKLSAVRVSVRDWPNYASVQIADTLDEVTIRRREFQSCAFKALVKVEVECSGLRKHRQKRSDVARALPAVPDWNNADIALPVWEDANVRFPRAAESFEQLKPLDDASIRERRDVPDISDIKVEQLKPLVEVNNRGRREIPRISESILEQLQPLEEQVNLRDRRALPDIPKMEPLEVEVNNRGRREISRISESKLDQLQPLEEQVNLRERRALPDIPKIESLL